MNNQLHVYSNLADAPDIPNEHALVRLLDRRVVNYGRGKLRYEHVYEITFNASYLAEYNFIKSIDHGDIAE